MNDFEREKSFNNQERIKSIGYQLLEKGLDEDITRVLTYPPKADLTIPKTGSEIKGKLLSEIQSLESFKTNTKIKLASLYKEIGESPYKELDSYVVEGWEGKIEIPLTYCHTQIYDEANRVENSNAGKMREYNQLARKYFDKSISIKRINTIINALNDTKKYNLTIDIATKLGF